MRFVLNMAGREIRGSGGRLLVFFFCIAIGVASMVSVRSFTDRLAASTARDARALVAADVRIDTPDLEQPGLRDLLARFTSSALVIDYTETVETQTMARITSNEDTRPALVELRGVRKEFPLHGAVHLSSAGCTPTQCSRIKARSCRRRCCRDSASRSAPASRSANSPSWSVAQRIASPATA